MKVSRAALVGVATWLVVVAVGSTLVWVVISRAGAGVVSSDQTAFGSSTSPAPQPSSSAPSKDPSKSSSGRPSQQPTVTTSPSESPTGPASPAGGASGPATQPATSAPEPPPPVTARRATWQGPGGRVVAECRGASVSLASAQPNGGYAIDVGDRGPEQLEVEFEGRDSGAKFHVTAVCSGGAPRFSVESENGGAAD
ncbi:MAG: hypothetical protein JWO11_2076 [Nocardioides sp.]|nr:hypothetical protein [Nocardioides sp.]